jgi:hypothetical protein
VRVPRRPVRSALSGPTTRADAVRAGLTDWHLRHRDVARLSRDTYLPLDDVGDLRDRLPAVLLTAPPGAVISHSTAAALWRIEIPLQQDDQQRAHLTVPASSGARNRRDRRIHRGELRADEVTRRWKLPVTTPERTWRDLAGVLPPPALLAVTDQLLDLWTTRDELRGMLDRHPTGRGADRARRVLPVASELAESPMESVVRWLVHEAGLPAPVLQHAVRDAAGVFQGRADLSWPDRKVLVEFDGDVHRDRTVFVVDLRRQNRLVAAGWTILRFSSADVMGRPEKVIAVIRAALGR